MRSTGLRRLSAVSSATLSCGMALLLDAAALPAQPGTIPPGFTPLFNGRDLAGWHVSRTTHHGIDPDVSVEGGVLVLRQRPFGQGGVLLTDRSYRDFELYLEARPDWGTNGGIFLRSSESGSAYQVELAGGNGATGDLFGEMLRVTTRVPATGIGRAWRDDDWNAFRLRVTGEVPRVALWVNDVLLYDVQLERNDLIADATAGMIGLQVHWSATYTPGVTSPGMERTMHHMWKPGAAHRFRNLAIREIERVGKREEGRGKRGTATAGLGQGEGRGEDRGEGRGEDRGGDGTNPRSETRVAHSTSFLGMEFVRIEPGSMVVGRFQPACPPRPSPDAPPGAGLPDAWDPRAAWSPEDHARCERMAREESSPGFTVTIDRPYYVGRYEVTQAEWTRVMGGNPSVFQGSRVEGDAGRHPVDSVGWDEVQEFLRRLNEQDPSGVYRLPTEFEWEYAARAGRDEDPPWDEVREQAWLQLVDKGTTRPVGGKRPNAWGLHDMLGNVWEWVQDYHNGRSFPDPAAPQTGRARVLRGGSFLSDVKNTTPRARGAGPGNGFDVGFRIVREARRSGDAGLGEARIGLERGPDARGGFAPK